MNVLYFAICWFMGIFTAILFGKINRKYDGVLKIDPYNPEKDIYRMEFNKLVDLSKRKRFVLKIEISDLSQK